jgi:hypothetical protein
MAIYHVSVKRMSRSHGQSAPAALLLTTALACILPPVNAAAQRFVYKTVNQTEIRCGNTTELLDESFVCDSRDLIVHSRKPRHTVRFPLMVRRNVRGIDLVDAKNGAALNIVQIIGWSLLGYASDGEPLVPRATRIEQLGKEFYVSIPLNCGTGFRWRFVPDSPFDEVSSKQTCPAQPGARGYLRYLLLPKQRGDFTLTWKLQRPGEEAYRVEHIRVHVD